MVVPVFNGARFLEDCLNSVFEQSLVDFEVVVADDFSMDDSMAIVERFADRRIRIIRNVTNVGLFNNLNNAIRSTNAPLVRFLCQDDVLNPTCLEEEVRFFRSHPDVSMTFCKAITVDPFGHELYRWSLNDLEDTLPSALAYQHFFFHECIPGNLTTVCVRAEAFRAIGGFDPSFAFAADFDLWVRLCQTQPMGVIHQHLVNIRQHDNQLSRADKALVEFVRERRRIRRKVRSILVYEDSDFLNYYERWRLSVADLNAVFFGARQGRLADSYRLIRLLGFRESLTSFAYWLLTLNNRLICPKPRFSSRARVTCDTKSEGREELSLGREELSLKPLDADSKRQ